MFAYEHIDLYELAKLQVDIPLELHTCFISMHMQIYEDSIIPIANYTLIIIYFGFLHCLCPFMSTIIFLL